MYYVFKNKLKVEKRRICIICKSGSEDSHVQSTFFITKSLIFFLIYRRDRYNKLNLQKMKQYLKEIYLLF